VDVDVDKKRDLEFQVEVHEGSEISLRTSRIILGFCTREVQM
jgi:hypothetical protein